MAKLDIAALAARLEELNKPRGGGGSGDKMTWANVKDGRNVFRILPAKDDDSSFYEEVWVHYGVGKTESNKKGTMVVCPKTHNENAECPVCELSSQYKKMSKKKDDQYDKEARNVYRKRRVYYNVIDRSDDLSKFELRDKDGSEKQVWFNTDTNEEESPVKVLGSGVEVFKQLLGFIVDPEYGDITDAEEGLDVVITKTGSGQYSTNYDVKTVRKESPVGYDQWAEALNDLKSLTKAKTAAELEALLNGEEPSGNADGGKEEDEDDGKPVDISDNSDDKGGADEGLQDEIKAALARRKAGK